MPVFNFKTIEELPEDLRDQAKEKADKSGFEISLVAQSKLDQFRDNNIAVSKELDETKRIVEALRPIVGDDLEAFKVAYGELSTTAQRVKDGSLKTTDAIDKELEARTVQMKGTYEAQLQERAKELATAKANEQKAEAKYRISIVDQRVMTAAGDEKLGVNPKALPDILARARELFEVQPNGDLLPKRNGVVLRGEDGTAPMSVLEWLKVLRSEADYYFKSSRGGGASGDGTNNNAQYGGFSQEDFNKLSPMERLKIANRVGA